MCIRDRFFAEFPGTTLIVAGSGALHNDYVEGPAISAEQSSSQSQCQYYPDVGTICGDSSYDYREVDYFRAGVGPIGYLYDNSYSDCGGGFCSGGSWLYHIGLESSTLSGGPSLGDEVEPNDSRAAAQAITCPAVVEGSAAHVEAGTSVTLTFGGNTWTTRVEDHYRFTLAASRPVTVALDFGTTQADMDLLLWNDGTGALVGVSLVDNPATGVYEESITATLGAGTYVIGVDAYSSGGSYYLEVL